MTKSEFTGRRDLGYSLWHRTIGSDCYMIDIDGVEWRDRYGVVALTEETIDWSNGANHAEIFKKKEFEIKVLNELSLRLDKPAYIIPYQLDLSEPPNKTIDGANYWYPKTFWVYEIVEGTPKFVACHLPHQMAKFLRSLKGEK